MFAPRYLAVYIFPFFPSLPQNLPNPDTQSSKGALVCRDWHIVKSLFRECYELLQLIHDSVDMNMLPAILYILAPNALMLFDLQQGVSIALNMVWIVETTCELLNATNTEVKFSCHILIIVYRSKTSSLLVLDLCHGS
mgnify:CR=1 FL=1